MYKLTTLASCLLVFLTACSAIQEPNSVAATSAVSHIFTNGNVLTVDKGFSTAESVAIRNNKIVAVGDNEEVMALAGNNTKVIDLSGKTMMPAFIDAHLHVGAILQFGALIDVGLTKHRTIEEAIDAMKKHGAKAEKGEWLLFKNVDFGTQFSNTMTKLTAKTLDQISKENPVFVIHAGGHISSVNSKLLEIMKVTKDTPNPAAGGSFGRYDTGEANGMLYGFATSSALGVIEPFKTVDINKNIIEVSNDFLSKGIGTVGDAAVGATGTPNELDNLERFSAEKKMKFRVRGYLSFGLEKQWSELGIKPNHGNEKVRIVGYKLLADGSNQARTGLQRKNYLGKNSHGIHYLTEEKIYQHIKDKSAKGFQLAIHGNGDASIDNIIAAVKRAKEDNANVIRPRIEHCSIVQDDQLQKLIELDITCSFLIGHVKLWGAAFKNNVFGLEKAEKLDRTGSFERVGIPYSLHTDNLVTDFSPLEMVEIAVTRELYSEPDYILAPDERASREMALRAVTSTSAWQLMSEHEVGSIEVGKLADFVVLDGNPLKVELDKIGLIKVLETWVDGEQVYSR